MNSVKLYTLRAHFLPSTYRSIAIELNFIRQIKYFTQLADCHCDRYTCRSFLRFSSIAIEVKVGRKCAHDETISLEISVKTYA